VVSSVKIDDMDGMKGRLRHTVNM